VRALILAGDLAARRDDLNAALELWQRVEGVSRDHLPLIAAKVTSALDRLGRRGEALNWVRRGLLDAPSIDLLDIAYQRTAEWEGPMAAESLVSDELKRHPSLLGFERLAEARLALNPGDEELASMSALLKAHARKLSRYRCSRCGFRAREFHWHCPGCSNWDSYPPRRIEDVEGG